MLSPAVSAMEAGIKLSSSDSDAIDIVGLIISMCQKDAAMVLISIYNNGVDGEDIMKNCVRLCNGDKREFALYLIDSSRFYL